MKLEIDLSRLWAAVDQMGADRIETELGVLWTHEDLEFDTSLSSGGVEIDLSQLETDSGLLSVKGRQVVLFIPDHGARIEGVLAQPSSGNKFHIADCGKLDEMRRRNRFERYKVTNNLSGDFPIYGQYSWGDSVTGDAALNVCKLCLKKLNYKSADTGGTRQRQNVVDTFELGEFFSTYSSMFRVLPKQNIEDVQHGYTADWGQISRATREQCDWTCQHCQINLSKHPQLLHVHHKNGEKSDNRRENLVSLCLDCHRKEPYHGHMNVLRKHMVIINKLRNAKRAGRSLEWGNIYQSADPATHGFLDYCEKRRETVPDVGYELVSQSKGSIVLELAWPQKRLGVYLGQDPIEYHGWQILSLADAMDRYT